MAKQELLSVIKWSCFAREMELDWSHAEKFQLQQCQVGFEVDSSVSRRQGMTEEHVEENTRKETRKLQMT